jgi:hypothetical protein
VVSEEEHLLVASEEAEVDTEHRHFYFYDLSNNNSLMS